MTSLIFAAYRESAEEDLGLLEDVLASMVSKTLGHWNPS